MLNDNSRMGLICGFWLTAVAVIVGGSVAVGATPSTSALFLLICAVPMSVAFLDKVGAPSPKLARLLNLGGRQESRTLMADLRMVALGALVLVLSTRAVAGQERAQYRDFHLGGSLPSVAALSGTSVSQAKTIHERPALMQELEWRPSYFVRGSTMAQVDPVQQIVFSFYNDQLFRLVVDYDRQRTEGMADADMIDAISSVYGRISKAPVGRSGVLTQIEQESGTSMARWAGPDYSVVLYRASFPSGFRLVVTSLPLDALARTAVAQALRLDEREAPQREIARQKKEADDIRTSQQKAREANKAAFKP